jgi:hypothetical protein
MQVYIIHPSKGHVTARRGTILLFIPWLLQRLLNNVSSSRASNGRIAENDEVGTMQEVSVTAFSDWGKPRKPPDSQFRGQKSNSEYEYALITQSWRSVKAFVRTTCRQTAWKTGVRFPTWTRNFFSLQSPDWLWCPTTPSFSVGKGRGRRVKPTQF